MPNVIRPASAVCLVVALVALACQGAALAAGEADIRGPLPPMPYPDQAPRCAPARALATGVTVGFVLAGFYFMLRRRRRAARRSALQDAPPSTPFSPPGEELLGLPAGEFYARLLAAVRERLAASGSRSALAATPRELAANLADAAEMCERAERAEYGAADADEQTRRGDLEFVRGLLEMIEDSAARREVPDAL